MLVADLLQGASIFVLSIALLISFRQTRLIAKQSIEIAKQTSALASSLRRDSYQGMVRHVGEYTDTAMARDPALLEWFLASRGFPIGSATDNNRLFFLWVRLGIHQSHYFERMEGLVSDDTWHYWCATIKYDIESSGFDTVWEIISHTYTPGFIAFINSCIERRPSDVRVASTFREVTADPTVDTP
jgi:hypothetical protein